MGPWTNDDGERRIQYYQPLLWIYPAATVCLHQKFDTNNEITFHETVERNWKDYTRNVCHAASYMANVQFQDIIGIPAQLSSIKYDVGDPFICLHKSKSPQADYGATRHLATE